MQPERILVVGQNSFLASEFYSHCADLLIRSIGHRDIDRDENFRDVAVVVNFAFAPQFHKQAYDPALDVDRKIARRVRATDAHYVMISSRRVYPASSQWDCSERVAPNAVEPYGANKARVERGLREMLGDRLTVLRPGNVVGYEPIAGRSRFGAYLQNQLLASGVIRLTVSPATRRDLITSSYFCQVLREVLRKPTPGTFNVGSSRATAIGDAAQWLIEGFGSGRVLVEGHEVIDEFQLDSSLLRKTFGLRFDAGDLASSLRGIGQRLALSRSRVVSPTRTAIDP